MIHSKSYWVIWNTSSWSPSFINSVSPPHTESCNWMWGSWKIWQQNKFSDYANDQNQFKTKHLMNATCFWQHSPSLHFGGKKGLLVENTEEAVAWGILARGVSSPSTCWRGESGDNTWISSKTMPRIAAWKNPEFLWNSLESEVVIISKYLLRCHREKVSCQMGFWWPRFYTFLQQFHL